MDLGYINTINTCILFQRKYLNSIYKGARKTLSDRPASDGCTGLVA